MCEFKSEKQTNKHRLLSLPSIWESLTLEFAEFDFESVNIFDKWQGASQRGWAAWADGLRNGRKRGLVLAWEVFACLRGCWLLERLLLALTASWCRTRLADRPPRRGGRNHHIPPPETTRLAFVLKSSSKLLLLYPKSIHRRRRGWPYFK